MSEEDAAYVEEDLKSPCTQEIAVFRAFAEIAEKADDEVVVIDTAPTGHTLLLLNQHKVIIKKLNVLMVKFLNLQKNYCLVFTTMKKPK